MVAGLREFCEAMEAGEAIEARYTVRTVRLDLEPRPFGPEDVKHVRKTLGASQPLLARYLGVSVQALRSWEQGSRPVPAMAARFLDELERHADVLWTPRLRSQ
jgi:DNA-binding transcriptional regulator YiaG